MIGSPGPPGRVRKARIEVPQPAPDPPAQPELAGPKIAPPRLARYELVLPSGATVGVSVCGAGVPLVVIHGFGGAGILYAQTLSRLVRLGYLVLTIDAPGHGRSETIPLWSDFERYASMVTQTLDHLGIERAIFVGHSMGGRVVAELGARQPHRVIAMVLVDAIVGDVWDTMIDVFRVLPALYAGFGLGLLADTASTLVRFDNPRQALKLARLLAPTGVGHVLRPWRLAGPMLTILRASSSDVVLQRVREHGLTVFFVHGDRDVLVPLGNARRAAAAADATLVTVHGARHSWLLSDPESFPALLASLGPVGLDAARTGMAVPEQRFYRAGAAVLAMTPDPRPVPLRHRHRAPRYRWSIEEPKSPG